MTVVVPQSVDEPNRRVECAHSSLPEIGYYTLAGAAEQPRDLIAEAHQAEALGIGHCFVSERFNTKEAAAICGAVGAVTNRLQITTAATNHNTRHPIVTASFATTMHRLTNGRFTLGIGRGVPAVQKAFGIPPVTTAQMEQFARLMRRLFRGEAVQGYASNGVAHPVLMLDPSFDENVGLAMVAFGPKSLELAGRCFDRVVLHTFFTQETLRRAVDTVRDSAERAGRDPDEIEVWSCLATVGDHLGSEAILRKTVARLATYLQAYGDLLVQTNDWDPAVLVRFRADPTVQSFYEGGSMRVIDSAATSVETLEKIAELLPAEWLSASATGTPLDCARAVQGELAVGASGVIMHGATPSELAPIIQRYRQERIETSAKCC